MIFGWILMGIAVLLGLIAVVLHIMVLVKLFKHGGVGLGILGLLCGLFTYIWGWIKSTELGLKRTMIWLTVFLVLSTVCYMAGAGLLVASSPEMQKALKDAEGHQHINSGATY